jgi:hypothetical protein
MEVNIKGDVKLSTTKPQCGGYGAGNGVKVFSGNLNFLPPNIYWLNRTQHEQVLAAGNRCV